MGTRSIPHDLPAVDARLVMPECGFEILGGEVFEVSPAYEPHGSRHSKLSALLEAYAAPGFNAASDMLTRTSKIDDFAPDGSIYPEARDPETGGRQLEQLAFEVVASETLAHAGRKAAALVRRGVRRVFAIDVERERALEWSCETDAWTILAGDAAIDDPALVLPLPIHDLVAAAHADDAVARALLAKRNPVIVAALQSERADEHADTMALAILGVLHARGRAPSDAARQAILHLRDPEQLAHALARAAICEHADDVLSDPLSPKRSRSEPRRRQAPRCAPSCPCARTCRP